MKFSNVLHDVINSFIWEHGEGIRHGFLPRKEWVKNKLLPFLCEGEYLDFLDVIHDKDKEHEAKKLWEKLYDYSEGVETQEWNYTMEQLFKTNNKRTPKATIDRDITIATDFYLLIHRVLHDDDKKAILPIVGKIRAALDSKDFTYINQHAYYEIPPPYKTPIREFLHSIAKEYDIKNKDYSIREFIEALPLPTETTYKF